MPFPFRIADCLLRFPFPEPRQVLVAYESGVMELWNLRTRARVHRFTSFVSSLASTLSASSASSADAQAVLGTRKAQSAHITCVVQSPAVDVVRSLALCVALWLLFCSAFFSFPGRASI